MEIIGIISLIFGIVGLISSLWYIGIIPCAVGIALGIVGLTDYLADKKFATAGLLISILGMIVSVYMFVSDIDSGKLIVLYNDGKPKSTDIVGEPKGETTQVSNRNVNINTSDGNNEKEQRQAENKTQKQEENTDTTSSVMETPKNETTKEEVQTSQNNGNQGENLLYQDENVIITYTGMSEDDYGWYRFNIVVENKSNRTLTVQVREMSINEFMVKLPTCSIDASPNKKAIGSIKITLDDAENMPFNSVGTAETKFHIFDYNDDDFGYDTKMVKIQ